jgi:hypothetical protein
MSAGILRTGNLRRRTNFPVLGQRPVFGSIDPAIQSLDLLGIGYLVRHENQEIPMPKMPMLALALLSSGAIVALAAGPAAAAPPLTCTDYGAFEYCTNLREESKEVTTPSGITMLQANLTYDAEYRYDNGQVVSVSETRHYQTLLRDNVNKEFHDYYTHTSQSSQYTCTFNFDYHYTNGTAQFDSEVGGCVSN